VLAALTSLGLDDETLVMYTSDHGELLGDPRHGGHAGKQVFYDAAWRVPLVVRDPRAAAAQSGDRVDALVDLVDLFPTIAEAAGLELPALRHGVSLSGVLSGVRERERQPARDHVFSQLHARNATRPHYGVRTGDWKLALYEPGEEQLFDLHRDPDERHNVFAQHPERVEELTRLLETDLALP
jgi:arylsulfatase A-like enzyme